jgi:hypothetical protein
MTIKALYESETEIPEAFRELFVEKNGKFEVQIEGMKTVADVERVQAVVRKLTDEKKALKDQLSAYGEHKAEDVQTKLLEYDVLKARLDGGADEAKLEEIRKKMENQIKVPLVKELEETRAKLGEALKQVEGLNGTLTRGKIESEFRSAASAAKVRSEAIEDILRYQDEFELGEGGVQLKNGDGVGTTLSQWLENMKDKRPHWWPEAVGAGSKGSGVAGYTGPNPWAAGQENTTEQGKIIKSNPALAEKLKAAAKAAPKKQ